MQVLFCLMLYHKSLRPSLLFLFSFCCSVWMLFTALSSMLLIRSSASSNLLLNLSSVCFVIVFISFVISICYFLIFSIPLMKLSMCSSSLLLSPVEPWNGSISGHQRQVIKGHPLCERFSSTCCESMLSLGHASCFSDTEEEHWGWGRDMPMALTRLYVALGTPGHKPCWFPKSEIWGAFFSSIGPKG